ncbi:putative secondary metabolism biosynthetic enzyme [Pestalotiopsis sp. IQ-011]
MVRAMIAQDETSGQWVNDHVSYVVAGGLGDLGRRLLTLMAQRGGKHLVTLSRKVPEDNDQNALQAKLEAIQPGCRLYCLQCDLTSERSVQQAAATLRDMGIPPVRGVINSAAILQDRPLSTMTYDEFSLASMVKVQGTLALERAFGTASLEFFIMLSSAVNIIGASGQANYNAGNAVQDALAQARQKDTCRYVSLNIGWIEDAVHTAENDARLRGLGRSGLRAIQHDEILRFLDHALKCSEARHHVPQAIIGFDAESLSKAIPHNGNIQSPMFSHIRRNLGATLPGRETATPTSKVALFKEIVAIGDDEMVLDFISTAICDRLVKLISVDISRIDDRHGSLLELGMDSLVAIELRNWLMREFDAPIQSSEIMDDQTIRALGEKVALRSRIVLAHRGSADHDIQEQVDMPQHGAISESVATTTNTNGWCQDSNLPLLPIPALEDTLRRFQESRCAFDSLQEQDTTEKAVLAFLEEIGPSLQQKVEKSSPAEMADNWEEELYLRRREPLQDYSEFSVGHPAREELEANPENASILAAINSAMFVVCLDDESPTSSGERHTQFLIGSPDQPFTNRWLDKTVQFVVAANGLSAGVYEHTKLDLLDVRTLHQRVNHEIHAHHNMESITPSSICPLREHIWRPSPVMLKHIQDLKFQLKSYHYVDHQYVTFENLGTKSLRALRASPHATAHLVALLAVYFVDGKIRPAWEVVSLGSFLHGRTDWVQTVSPAVRSFLEEASAAIADDKSGMVSRDKVSHLRPLFDAASTSHARAVLDTSRGLGFVNHLYALRGVLKRVQVDTDENHYDTPELFRTRIWNATRRGGAEQSLKIGFVPVEDSDHPDAWDEGGFLMRGDRGIYIHSSVHGHCMKFAVSAHPEYAIAVCNMLQTASNLVLSILG